MLRRLDPGGVVADGLEGLTADAVLAQPGCEHMVEPGGGGEAVEGFGLISKVSVIDTKAWEDLTLCTGKAAGGRVFGHRGIAERLAALVQTAPSNSAHGRPRSTTSSSPPDT